MENNLTPNNQPIIAQNGNPNANKELKITITLPTNAYFMSGVRNFTLGLVKNMTDFSEQWAFRFQSIIDELCNNAIEHGSNQDSEVKIIFISKPHDSFEIIVQDQGSGKQKMKAAEIQKIVEERRQPNYIFNSIRGRGLAKIVAEWTDEMSFKDLENGGVEVHVKKFLNDPKLKEMNQFMESPNHLVLN